MRGNDGRSAKLSRDAEQEGLSLLPDPRAAVERLALMYAIDARSTPIMMDITDALLFSIQRSEPDRRSKFWYAVRSGKEAVRG
jgi:hypothetical protein